MTTICRDSQPAAALPRLDLRALPGQAIALLSIVPLAVALWTTLPHAGTSSLLETWSQAYVWEALGRTFALSAGAATLAVAMAVCLAMLTRLLPPSWSVAIAGLSCLPLLLPSSLIAVAWIVAMGRQGVLWSIIPRGEWSIFTASGAAMVLATRYFGIVALLLVNDLGRQERNWPSARAFALSPATAALHLVLRRMIRPAVAGWLVVAMLAMNDHIIPDLLLVSTCGSLAMTYSAMLDLPRATAVMLPTVVVGLAILAALSRFARPLWQGFENSASNRPRPRSVITGVMAAAGSLAVLSMTLAVPVVVLAWRGASPRMMLDMLMPGDSRLSAFAQAVETIEVSAIAAPLTAGAAAIVASCWLARWRAGRRSICGLALVCLACPASLIALGLLHLFNLPMLAAWRDTTAPLVVGYACRFLPVATLVLMLAWRDESPLPACAARVHGVGAIGRLLHVHWPQRRLSLATVLLLAAVLAATELEVSTLLCAPGQATLGVRLGTLIHTASDAVVSALALDLLVLAIPPLAGLAILWALAARRARRQS